MQAAWKVLYAVFERLALIPFVTFWKLIRSHAVTSRWLDDCKECIQSGWNKQRDCCSLADQPRMLVASKAAFLENYLVVSTCIFHGSSIECHEKKHQPFCLFGVRFGSRAIQISGWKSAWRWSSVVTVNTKPTSSPKFSILGRKSFVPSKQFKWKAKIQILRKAWELV